jgi:hypothetical protein
MQQALGTLKEAADTGELIERPELTVGFEEYTELIGLTEYNEMEAKYSVD